MKNDVTFADAQKLIEEIKLMSPVIEDLLKDAKEIKHLQQANLNSVEKDDISELINSTNEIKSNIKTMKYIVSETKPRENRILYLSLLTAFAMGFITAFILFQRNIL